eukprot:189339_1
MSLLTILIIALFSNTTSWKFHRSKVTQQPIEPKPVKPNIPKVIKPVKKTNAVPKAVSNTTPVKISDPNEMLIGTYQFEIMGRPHKLYLCSSTKPKEKINSLHFAIADVTQNEYTIAVGRDANGVSYDGKHEYIANCKLFRLHGDEYLKGYYKIIYNSKKKEWTLYERFPEYINAPVAESQEWNTYQLKRVSPAITSNPTIAGHQCFQPDTYYQPTDITLWKSGYCKSINGYRYVLLSPNGLDCWKMVNQYEIVTNSGYLYGTHLEWDGTLMIDYWDDLTNPHDCAVGTQFLIFVDSETVLLSYQCDDRITGGQYLLSSESIKPEKRNKKAKKQMTCPFKLDNSD